MGIDHEIPSHDPIWNVNFGFARRSLRAPDLQQPVNVEVSLCVPENQRQHLPHHCVAPTNLHPSVPLPRQGEVVYLSPNSAWGVQLVVHEWKAPTSLRVEVWLEHVASGNQSSRSIERTM